MSNENPNMALLLMLKTNNKDEFVLKREFLEALSTEYFDVYNKAYPTPIAQQSLSGSEPKGSTPKSCSNCGRGFLIFCLKSFSCDKKYSEWEPA